jgi:hypothetical protein
LATVITNLLSAIPWLGKSLVEFLKGRKHIFLVIYFFLINWARKIGRLSKRKNSIKTYFLPGKEMKEGTPSLETIGKIHKNALKKLKKSLNINKQEYLSIPYSFIAFLVGLIDGDGYIQITKTGKGYISIKLVISLQLKDLTTLEYIQSVLKLGKITIYKDLRSPTCKLIINKTDLQEIFFPLLLYHNVQFLTMQRGSQFNMVMYILKENIIFYSCLPENPYAFYKLPKSAQEYVNLSFFKNWIVGFVVAEGSFFVKANNDCCFQIKQKMHYELFEAFKIVFNTNRKINIDKFKNSQFGVSSKNDIQRVIDFFSFSGLHPLVGLKWIQYLSWLENLSKSIRYKNLRFPGSVL